MLEIYCDSSFNGDEPSYIGCVVLRDGREVHQSTTRILPDPTGNLDCERAAISFAISMINVFRHNGEPAIIYNDSTEAVREFQAGDNLSFSVEYMSREDINQSVADRMSKKFPQVRPEKFDLCKRPVEAFTSDILKDIALNHRSILYLVKDPRESTNTRTCYILVIRTVDGVISDDGRYTARAGEIKNIKVAQRISGDLGDPARQSHLKALGADLEGSYFLLTDETWGLRLKGGEAYSILPCTIPHRIICHEVDRSPENLFRRAASVIR